MLLYSQVTFFTLQFIGVPCTDAPAINTVCKKEHQAKLEM